MLRSRMVSSEPIWPVAPITRIFFIIAVRLIDNSFVKIALQIYNKNVKREKICRRIQGRGQANV